MRIDLPYHLLRINIDEYPKYFHLNSKNSFFVDQEEDRIMFSIYLNFYSNKKYHCFWGPAFTRASGRSSHYCLYDKGVNEEEWLREISKLLGERDEDRYSLLSINK